MTGAMEYLPYGKNCSAPSTTWMDRRTVSPFMSLIQTDLAVRRMMLTVNTHSESQIERVECSVPVSNLVIFDFLSWLYCRTQCRSFFKWVQPIWARKLKKVFRAIWPVLFAPCPSTFAAVSICGSLEGHSGRLGHHSTSGQRRSHRRCQRATCGVCCIWPGIHGTHPLMFADQTRHQAICLAPLNPALHLC